MSNRITINLNRDPTRAAGAALRAVAYLWFLAAVIGQWIFVYYIVSFYGGSAVQGDMEAWNKIIPHAYIAGATAGNIAIAAHLFLAAIIIVGGPLQLMLGAIITAGGPLRTPLIQTSARYFHHWNGRLYIPTVIVASLTGLYMIWIRGTAGGFIQHVGLSLDGVFIIIFAVIALRYAIARKIATHRRWALRLFMVVSGVWFIRVGWGLWFFLSSGPLGEVLEGYQGSFSIFQSFASYLLPLGVLELYLHVQDHGDALGKFVMAGGLIVLTVLMSAGIIMATRVMWLPLL